VVAGDGGVGQQVGDLGGQRGVGKVCGGGGRLVRRWSGGGGRRGGSGLYVWLGA
jgi:hypothetical protein